jgi:hypothetical protein
MFIKFLLARTCTLARARQPSRVSNSLRDCGKTFGLAQTGIGRGLEPRPLQGRKHDQEADGVVRPADRVLPVPPESSGRFWSRE